MAYFKKYAIASATVMIAMRCNQVPPMRISRLPRDFGFAGCANVGGATSRGGDGGDGGRSGDTGDGGCGGAGGLAPIRVCIASRRVISSLRVSGGVVVCGGAMGV